MNILFITPRIPYPPYRGDKLHVYNLVRRLAARHRVGLVTFVENEAERAYIEPLAEHCSYIRVTHLSKWTSLLNVASVLFDRTPFQVAYYRSRAFAASVREAVAAFRPDIVHSHLIRTVQYTRAIEGIPRVLGLTDAVSLYLQRFADQEGNPLKRALVRMELARIVRYESVAADYDRALVCSATDREVILDRAPGAEVGILYNGVDLDSFTPRDDITPEPGRIIFTGNMTYFPNIDAVEWMLAEILPAIKRRVPHARLYVVGQNPPAPCAPAPPPTSSSPDSWPTSPPSTRRAPSPSRPCASAPAPSTRCSSPSPSACPSWPPPSASPRSAWRPVAISKSPTTPRASPTRSPPCSSNPPARTPWLPKAPDACANASRGMRSLETSKTTTPRPSNASAPARGKPPPPPRRLADDAPPAIFTELTATTTHPCRPHTGHRTG
jgi:hypothetical protein